MGGRWFEKYNVSSWLDIPCGDCNWQGLVAGVSTPTASGRNVQYYGYDIAPTAVAKAQEKNREWTNMRFGVADMTSAIPMTADFMTMRDVLQHLPLGAALQALSKAKAAGIKWLAVSTYPTRRNMNIMPGKFYCNNVQE